MTEKSAAPIHEVFPYLTVANTSAAVEFYKQAFGATEIFRLVEPSGRVGHVELQLGPVVLMLADEFPEFGIQAPGQGGAVGFRLHLHVDNCDAWAKRAVAAGATLESEPQDQFYGERGCRLRDPFGHRWLIGHSIEKLTPEEMQRRYTALFAAG